MKNKCRNSEMGKNLDVLEKTSQCVYKMFTAKGNKSPSGCMVKIDLWGKKKKDKETKWRNIFSSLDCQDLCGISDRRRQKYKLIGN